MICMLSFSQKSNGIQNVIVFPIPVPAIEATSWSPLRMASMILICQRHGRQPKTVSVWFCILDSEGIKGIAMNNEKKSEDWKLDFILIKFPIDSPPSLVTVAELVDKCFVPGPIKQLKKIRVIDFQELQTFKSYGLSINWHWGACSLLLCYRSKMQMIGKHCQFHCCLVFEAPVRIAAMLCGPKPQASDGSCWLSCNLSQTLMCVNHQHNLLEALHATFSVTFGYIWACYYFWDCFAQFGYWWTEISTI